MDANTLISEIKRHPQYDRVGMILCHNGVVRGTSRDGRKVSGLKVMVDRQKLEEILAQYRAVPGIVDIRVHIAADRDLAVGDDVMLLVVAGDIRETVIDVLTRTLNAIKTTVTAKTEFFV
ncbi:molybdenum cofactor biosynthesis protein MoaE [Desulfosarcina sp. OttesenSCG-928-G10]|nr:molybdenum cofactor biosynthesis protein MoaE [Desulfosarcina sp. OttesenSCG-928-G10]